MKDGSEELKKKLTHLCISFLKIGAFTFGGGYAMIPLISKEIVERYHWLTDEEMINIFAIAECTPGVIAVNCATFVGYKVAGFLGSLLSTISVVLPAFITICIISLFYESFKDLLWVTYAFKGIRLGVIVLLMMAILKISKHAAFNIFNIGIFIAVIFISVLFNINTIFILLIVAAAGILYNAAIQTAKQAGKK